MVKEFPDQAVRYFKRAVPEGQPLYQAAWITMKGRLKLKDWSPFCAEEVICWPHGFVWGARTKMGGLPVTGFDESLDGVGRMDWRVFGFLPVARADGEAVSQSAMARFVGELIWIPTVFMTAPVDWSIIDGDVLATVATDSGPVAVLLKIDHEGVVRQVSLQRYRTDSKMIETFVVESDAEGDFGGLRVPSRIRAGWGSKDRRLDPDGAFFEAEIESIEFRS
jgi:hypothetical protein